MSAKILVNQRSKGFIKTNASFAKPGCMFNTHFTDYNATSTLDSEDIYTKLLFKKIFKIFASKAIYNTINIMEAHVALSAESRQKVDEMVNRVAKVGIRRVC